MQTSNAQRSWNAFSAEDREERRALGGITLKMYDEDEVPLDHALRPRRRQALRARSRVSRLSRRRRG